jgi:hypothetical protein
VSVALVVASLAAVVLSHADERVSLAWDAPPECPAAGEVHAAIGRMVGPRAEARVRARAGVTRGPDGYRGRVEVETADGRGERAFEAATCAAVADAIALVVALAIDPQAAPPSADAGAPPDAGTVDVATTAAVADAADAAPRDAAPTNRPPSASAPAAEAPAPPSPRAPGRALHASLGGLADTATLPDVALGVAASVAWTPSIARARPLRLELTGGYATAARATAPSRPRVGGTFGLAPMHMSVCYMYGLDRLEVGGCAGGGVSLVPASSDGASAPGSALAALGELGGGGLGLVRVAGPVSLRLSLSVAAPLTRPSFVVDGVGALHRPALASGRASVGLEVSAF